MKFEFLDRRRPWKVNMSHISPQRFGTRPFAVIFLAHDCHLGSTQAGVQSLRTPLAAPRCRRTAPVPPLQIAVLEQVTRARSAGTL
jgi:hypothetical protein